MFSEWDVFFDTGDPPIAVILWGVNAEQATNADWATNESGKTALTVSKSPVSYYRQNPPVRREPDLATSGLLHDARSPS